MHRSSPIFHTLATVIIAIVALALIEAGLRCAFPEKVHPQAVLLSDRTAYMQDNAVLFKLKPNLSKRFTRSRSNGGDVINWRTNSLGFRGSELQRHPSRRIVVYGDSNIQARFSELKQTFVYKLGQYLTAEGNDPVEVINAGVVGAGPDQSLIRLSTEMQKLNPDLVVFHIFADNDFGDLIRNRLFELDGRGVMRRLETKDESSSSLTIKLLRDAIRSLLIVRMAKKLIRIATGTDAESAKRDVLIERLKVLAESEYVVYQTGGGRQFSHFDDHYDLDVAAFPNSESAKQKMKLLAAVLSEARKLTERDGARFLVVIQPSVVDLTQNYLFSFHELKRFPEYRPTNLTAGVEQACLKLNVPFVNLYGIFANKHPGRLFFDGGDNHWNDNGQELAAKAVARFISENNLL